jgi:serine/threonine protein kinase
MEVAISKLCSLFGIGPQMELSIPVDLVVYNNAIVFHMEECHPFWKMFLQNKDIKSVRENIIRCIKILHNLQIVHKDIKPENFVWSTSQKKYVFCDFTLSHYVIERKTESTLT